MPTSAIATENDASSPVQDAEGNPHWNGDLTLLSRWFDLAERKLPSVSSSHVTLIKRGYLNHRNRTIVSSAEQAAVVAANRPACTFSAPAKLYPRTATELSDTLKDAGFTLGYESLAEAHQAVVDVYLSWMDRGTADEWRITADGNAHTLLTKLVEQRDRSRPRVNQAVKAELQLHLERGISEPSLSALNAFIEGMESWNRAITAATRESDSALALLLGSAFRDLGEYYEGRIDSKIDTTAESEKLSVVKGICRDIVRDKSAANALSRARGRASAQWCW